jgi:hypothetical protein
MANMDCLEMEAARDLARALLAWLTDPELEDRMGWLQRAHEEVDEGRDPSRPGAPDPELDRAGAMEVFGPEAADTIEHIWAEVTSDSLPVEVRERAVETLIDGGVSGIPKQFVAFDSDPREALALALGEDDPRAGQLRAHLAAEPNIVEQGTRLIPWDGERLPHREMERGLSRRRSALRGRSAHRCQSRSRPARRRASTGTSLAGTDPPLAVSDDDPDLVRRFLRGPGDLVRQVCHYLDTRRW